MEEEEKEKRDDLLRSSEQHSLTLVHERVEELVEHRRASHARDQLVRLYRLGWVKVASVLVKLAPSELPGSIDRPNHSPSADLAASPTYSFRNPASARLIRRLPHRLSP